MKKSLPIIILPLIMAACAGAGNRTQEVGEILYLWGDYVEERGDDYPTLTISPDERRRILRDLPVINFSSAITRNVPDRISWNDLAEEITFIPIETSDEVLLGNSVEVFHVSDDSYWVVDRTPMSRQVIFRIDRNGKAITQLSRYGRGPGEVLYIEDIYADQGRGIIKAYDGESKVLVEWDLTGRLIRETNLRGKVTSSRLISGDYSVFAGMQGSGCMHKIIVTDSESNIIYGMYPDDLSDRWTATDVSRTFNSDMAIIDTGDDDEIVFRITDKGVEPLFVLRMGSWRRQPGEPSPLNWRLPNGEPPPKISTRTIGSIPNYYIIRYRRMDKERDEGWYCDLWSKATQQIISRRIGSSEYVGLGLTLASGKTINASPTYIYGDTVVMLIQADEVYDAMDGMKRDDNPVIVHIKLKR